ncbi:ATP-binding protein [Flavobacterium enshiense]|uniref:sensor histidine kinase n=1 Tax=Flavobacterium enshiense TaxID=1341165 RepID=UPI00345DDCF3
MKDSFDYYKEKRAYLKAFHFSEKQSNLYLSKKKYPEYVNQVIKSAELLSIDIKDNKRAYKLTLNALRNTNNKIREDEKIKLLNCLSFINISLQRYPQALKIAIENLKLSKKIKNDTLIAKTNRIIQICNHNSQNTDSLYKYLQPFLKSAYKIKDYRLIADAYNYHYAFYNMIDEHDIGKIYLDSALIFANKSKDLNTINILKNNIGADYINKKDYKKAIEIYLDIINSDKKNRHPKELAIAKLNLSYVYENLGEFKKAYQYQTSYVDYVDSLRINKNDTEIEQIRTQYELDKAENTFNEKELLLKQKQLKSEKMLYLLLTVLLFLGILFYFFYQNLKLRQKNKLKDVYQKTQQNIINATIDGQEEERKRLSGVLHDNISALLSSAGLHISAFEANYPDMKDELKKTKSILKEAHDKVRDLSHDLIPPVLEKLGLVAAYEDLCEKNSNSLIEFNFNYFIERETRFQNDFEMKLYFIVAELFNNIIKHSNASKAFLTLDQSDNQLVINIEDNGKGFEIKEGKSKEGLGLSQIKTRIKSLNGTININSKEKSGTIIYIKVEIPKEKSNAISQFHNA